MPAHSTDDRRNPKRRSNDRMAFAIILGIPVTLILLFCVLFGR